MGRLDMQKEIVDFVNGNIALELHVPAEPCARKKPHRLFGSDTPGARKDAQRPITAVQKRFATVLQKKITCPALILNHAGNNIAEPLHQIVLRNTERRLVADLVKITERPRPFPVNPPDRQIDLLDPAKDPLHFPGFENRRQMQHDADANTGSEIRRAGGQIAEPLVKGERQLMFQRIVEPIDPIPNRRKTEPGGHRLNPQMVLLVDHDAEILVAVDQNGPRLIVLDKFTADQLAFEEILPIRRLQLVHFEKEKRIRIEDFINRRLKRTDNIAAVELRNTADKRITGKVSGEPNPTRNHNVSVRTAPSEPSPLLLEHIVNSHALSPFFIEIWSLNSPKNATRQNLPIRGAQNPF